YLKERYRQDATSRYKADAFMTKPYQRLELQRLSLKLLAERLKTTPAELRSRLGKAKEADHEIDRHAQLEAERASSSPEGTKAKAGEAVRVKGRQQKIADAAMNTMRARAIFEDISKHLGERQVGEELSSSSADPGSETIMASPGKPHAEPVEQAFVSPSTFRRGDARKENLRIYSEELFFTELNLDMSRCRRSGQPLSLVLVRVGDLPEILQLFGAAFRDQVLNYVAERAVASMRDVDMAGLLGDEASVAIAAFAADRDGVDRILARIHRSMRHYPLSAGEGVPAVVPSLRVGAAVYPREAQDLDGLVTRARNELTV
ncbi:MAG: GGDEF domain-containing protein, partial [Acidobacteriota bacterium]